MKDLRNGVLVDLPAEDVAKIEAWRAALAAEVPPVVSKMQARLALLEAGKLDSIEAAVAAADAATQIYWADVSEIHRNHPVVLAVTGGVGISPEQLDELFRQAAKKV